MYQDDDRSRRDRCDDGMFAGLKLPDVLRKLGYDVTEMGEGERIVPTAIIEKLSLMPTARCSL
jgi:hypothetical protein